ncbi:macrolide family glycosyltransferase [Kribbella sp. CA-294648]|uniref:macrolide family glycosyltransferase n=1 Tax=Kribbella sp. CA-294648 TaxID=3239948 RepID=UPI003D938721
MAMHVAFLTIPAAGHINPTLPLVTELARRGHRVSYASGPAFREAIENAGAQFVEIDWAPPTVKASRTGQTTEELADMLLDSIVAARRAMPVAEHWLRVDRPDVFCYDMMTLLGPVLAERLDLLHASTIANFAGNEYFDLTSAVTPETFDPTIPRFQQFLAERAAFAADAGLPVELIAAPGVIAPLNFVFIPREFQIAGDTFDERFHFVGPAIGSRIQTSPWNPPADGSPLLYISLGTLYNQRSDIFALCIKAFGGSGWRVAMAVGDKVDRTPLGEIPFNFDVRSSFPQPEVLRHAAAFLSHAGMNSVMESLLNQVPLAMLPQTPEQFMNARRVAELGLGRLAESSPSPESLRQTVDELAADPGIQQNLATMASLLVAGGGAEAAADALEAHADPT